MKSYRILVTASALLSATASAADLGSRAASASAALVVATPSTSRKLDDNEPWETGTKVYNNFPDEGWWSGTITSYSEATGMYTVTWEDGSTDYYDDDDKIDEMVAYAQNDPQNNPAGASSSSTTYPVGTPVSSFEDGEWSDGTVIKYGSGSYTVQWEEDGEIEQIAAGAIMDKMVDDGNGDDDAPPEGYSDGPEASGEFSKGTPVSVFEDGEWTDGEITGYSDNVYFVKWADGSVDEYDDSGDDLAELKKAVADGNGDDDGAPEPVSGPKFPIGTPVSDYEDEEWVDGTVVDFQDGNYIVQWDDEDEPEFYASSNAEDMQELTEMASNGAGGGDDDAPPDSFFEENDLWNIGTPVAVTEEGQIWYGKIDNYKSGEYSITWDTGSQEWLDNYDLVNDMVSKAALTPQKKGMSGFGKAFLSLFLIAGCVVGAAFGYKFYEKKQDEQRQTSGAGNASSSYRDEPDELPKII
jgi:hypothetical protein